MRQVSRRGGTYDLSPSMTIDQIITNLKKGKVLKQAKLKFTIPEGLQLDEIAKIIAKHTDYDQAEILKKRMIQSILKA